MTSSFYPYQIGGGAGRMERGARYGSARRFYISDKDLKELAEEKGAEFRSMRSSERNELKELNNSFASYIERVRFLEMQNLILKAQYRQISAKYDSKLVDLYFVEVIRLMEILDAIKTDCTEIESDIKHIQTEVEELKEELENVVQDREKLDRELTNLRQDVDECTLVRVDLERKLISRREELDIENLTHNEVVDKLKCQIVTDHILMQIQMENQGPDLSAILLDIRAQYDLAAKRNKEEAESWYRSKLNDLNMSMSQNVNHLNNARIELHQYRQQVSSQTGQIESLRSNKEYLERQLADLEDRYRADTNSYQEQVADLQNQLDTIKSEMDDILKEYQEVMVVKLGLDFEISTYQKLLEGEEFRLQTVPSRYSPGEQMSLRKVVEEYESAYRKAYLETSQPSIQQHDENQQKNE